MTGFTQVAQGVVALARIMYCITPQRAIHPIAYLIAGQFPRLSRRTIDKLVTTSRHIEQSCQMLGCFRDVLFLCVVPRNLYEFRRWYNSI